MLNETMSLAPFNDESVCLAPAKGEHSLATSHYGRSLAGVLLGVLHAGVALHVTTPVKLAVAVPCACVLVSVVPAAAAQQVTATWP